MTRDIGFNQGGGNANSGARTGKRGDAVLNKYSVNATQGRKNEEAP